MLSVPSTLWIQFDQAAERDSAGPSLGRRATSLICSILLALRRSYSVVLGAGYRPLSQEEVEAAFIDCTGYGITSSDGVRGRNRIFRMKLNQPLSRTRPGEKAHGKQNTKAHTHYSGGFAGLTVAMELERKLARDPSVEITLINRENFFLFTPMLHESRPADLDLTTM